MIIPNTQNITQNSSVKVNTESEFKQKHESVAVAQAERRVDTFKKQNSIDESVTYEPPKKLTTDQIEALNRERVESTLDFITTSVKQNVTTQAQQTTVSHNGYEISTESANLLIDIFGSMENAMPTPATTPEGALEDISEGGAYSVESVSSRIMLMATSLAGDDPEMLTKLQNAVMQGFEAAGLNLETGEGMPEITMSTYQHVMREFEKLKAGAEAEEKSAEEITTESTQPQD